MVSKAQRSTRAARREELGHAGRQVVRVVHVGEDVAPEEHVRGQTLLAEGLRQRAAEPGLAGGHAGAAGGLRGTPGGIDAEHGHAGLGEVAQQVAVVARQLDHEARTVQPEAIDCRLHVATGVFEPRVRVR
jgi:hypothetical protein